MKNILKTIIQEGSLIYFKIIFDRILFYTYYKHIYKACFKKYGKNIRWGKHSRYRCIPKSVRIGLSELISIGDDCCIDEGVYLQCFHEGRGISISKNSRINTHTHILAYDHIEICENVLIAPFCLISSGNHKMSSKDVAIKDQNMSPAGKVVLGNGSWIGQGSKILGDLTIGMYSVIGAGTILTSNVGDNELFAGNPGSFKKKITVEEIKSRDINA